VLAFLATGGLANRIGFAAGESEDGTAEVTVDMGVGFYY